MVTSFPHCIYYIIFIPPKTEFKVTNTHKSAYQLSDHTAAALVMTVLNLTFYSSIDAYLADIFRLELSNNVHSVAKCSGKYEMLPSISIFIWFMFSVYILQLYSYGQIVFDPCKHHTDYSGGIEMVYFCKIMYCNTTLDTENIRLWLVIDLIVT